jgi:GR25 family glycosyltransferase involved in LPS biosynthesis
MRPLVDPNNYKTYYDNNNKINNPFIISLKKDTIKYKNTKRILNELGLEPIKFDAIYGKNIKENHPSIYKKFGKLNEGEIGCFMSHFSIYYLASLHQNQNQYTMIFEDDIGTHLNKITFQKKLNDIVKYDANMIYLGKCGEFCNKMNKIENDIYEGYSPYCMHAYLIKNSFAKKLVDNITPLYKISSAVDAIIFDWIQKNDIIEFHPSIFYQDSRYKSNLRSRVLQMASEFECRDQIQMPMQTIKQHIYKIILVLLLMIVYFMLVF